MAAAAVEAAAGAGHESGVDSGKEADETQRSGALKVTVQVADKVFTIPCGKGEQNMKWLASVVAQRYQMLTRSSGRARQRESQLDPSGFFNARNVTMASGEPAFPSVKIRDVMTAGRLPVINVELERVQEVEADGSKKQSTWAAMAYNFSETGRARAERKRAHDIAEEKARQDELERLAAEAKKKELDDMAKLLAVDMDNPKAVEEAMQRDWTHVRIEMVTMDDVEAAKIKRLFLKHFVAISDLFKVYSAYHIGGSMVAMCKQEFNHVVLVCKIMHTVRDREAIERIFTEVNSLRNDDTADASRNLTRFEFMEALLLLAMEKYRTPGGVHVAPSKCLERLLEGHVLPRVAKMAMGEVRSTLHGDDMVKYVLSRNDKLRRIFDHYKKQGHSADTWTPEADQSIDFDEFRQLLIDARLLSQTALSSSSSKKDELTQAETREVFAAVQRDSDAPSDMRSTAALNQSLSELVYAEYLEAVVRVGMEKWEDSRLPLQVRMKMGIDAVCLLDHGDDGVHALGKDTPLPDPEDYVVFTRVGATERDTTKTPFITEVAEGKEGS